MGFAQELSREEFEHLIEEKILEFARDPDEDLSVREEFIQKLEERSSESRISHEDIKEEFG